MKKQCLIAIAVVLAGCLSMASATTVSDDFSDGVIDPGIWSPPPDVDNANLTEIYGRLEFTTSVTPGFDGGALLGSQVPLPRDSDWSLAIDAFIDGNESAFPGFGSDDLLVLTMSIEPSGPASGGDGDDRAELNFAFLDLAAFGDSGFDHGLRFNGRTNDVDDEEIHLAGNPSALTAKLRLDYNAAATTISGAYDIGSGWVSLGDPVATNAWGMLPEETLELSLSAMAGTMGESPPANTYDVLSGQQYFDNFVSPAPPIPEPATLSLVVLGGLAIVRRRHR